MMEYEKLLRTELLHLEDKVARTPPPPPNLISPLLPLLLPTLPPLTSFFSFPPVFLIFPLSIFLLHLTPPPPIFPYLPPSYPPPLLPPLIQARNEAMAATGRLKHVFGDR